MYGPDTRCALCDSEKIGKQNQVDTLRLLDGDICAIVEVIVPVYSCHTCGQQWTNWEGEDIRTAAQKKYYLDKYPERCRSCGGLDRHKCEICKGTSQKRS